MRRTSVAALVGALLLSSASAAWAQQASAIAGIVKDTSGAVLPGVTVEASSPALIEKVRAVVTDGEGRYNIVGLRPGTYTVTFALPGFSSLKREDVELTAGFTATVNADLQVGSVTETLTVSGESPLVDVANVRTQNVVSKQLLDVLPNGNKTMNMIMTLTPGMTMGANSVVDVTGSRADFGSFHGKTGTKSQFDGMGIQNLVLAGSTGYIVNGSTVEEMVVQTSGISAESTADGAVANYIPKEGSNTFSGSLFSLYTNDSLQSNNMTDTLRARGLPEGNLNKVLRVYDMGLTLGGPIKRDRLWVFIGLRAWGNAKQAPGYWNKTQGTPFYTPDLSRPADGYQWYDSRAVRVTWQASRKNKLNAFVDPERTCSCGGATAGSDPVVSLAYHQYNGVYQVTWNAPVTNKLLFEAGGGIAYSDWPTFYKNHSPNDISILELSTNFRYGSRATWLTPTNDNRRATQRGSVSYVTGSHAFKAGLQIEEGIRNANTVANGNVNYTFNDGVPAQITQYATPYLEKERIKADLGLYVQDQWAIKRLTLDLGLRFDYRHDYVPPQHIPATPDGWIPARDFADVDCVPCFNDLDPRLGVAYDLFGNGKTAVKFSIGRYVSKAAVEIPTAANPINTSVNSVNRTWTDVNGDYSPNCDLGNFAANGECGAISNTNFGKNNPTATLIADDAIRGWGNRYYNWDMSTEVQHQLTPRISVTAGYYRNWFGNFAFAGGLSPWPSIIDNLLVTPSDYTPFCITAPSDQRLPNGGGYQVCGLYDLVPEKFGQVKNVITLASNYGRERLANDFVAANLTTRFRSGLRIGGGVDTGRTVNDTCFIVDSPQQMLNCRVVTPFSAQTQIKFNGSYPLPYDFTASGVLLSLSGPADNYTYTLTNAQVAPTLGRNLSACTRTPCTAAVTVPLVRPQTQFEDRITRFDLRLTKLVKVKGARLQGNIDIYNLFNASPITAANAAYGRQFLLPTQVMDGRLVEFSANLSF